ncbi:MAG: Crp/Fnr family transcriptional regulator [Chitinophagaceae bacterium]|nr:Crp/Fnr family transcriptional regulator [Chitinophagaceae bacterium]MCW5905261.1 Crp/Fnr family transcriptional regulator [Chitinophagaceae bacterium]
MTLKQHDCITCQARHCSILETCNTDILTAISTNKKSKKIQKGERLFSEGDIIKGIWFIRKGFLKVELNGQQGRPLILRIAGRGAIFGHRLTTKHIHHTNSATAISDVQFCYIPNNIFAKIACDSEALQQQIINQYLDELKHTEKKILELAHKSVKEKIADALLTLAETYQYEVKKQSFKITLCRQDIADFVGTTKEQVSKILKDFEKEGLIKCTAKKFNYLNIPQLRLIASTHT